MPILVNGELVPDELIRYEEQRLSHMPGWQDTGDAVESSMRRREAAERMAIDHMLLLQLADQDPRPVDAAQVRREVEQAKARNGCRAAFDDSALRREVERRLREQRVTDELLEAVPKPTPEDVERFYQAQRENFRSPEKVRAAHIVKHVDETQSEEEARAGVEAALAELERGVPFAEVVERYSDCKNNGGDLGTFQRGVMVEEFDSVVFAMQAGQRSGIFRTPFGFHIAEVREAASTGIASFDDVKRDLERVMTVMLRQEALQRIAASLRSQAAIHRVRQAAQ